MKLSTEQLKHLVKGAARVEEQNGSTHLYRFTEAEEAMYLERNRDLYVKTFSTAGIRLELVTDSTSLSMEVEVAPGCSRTFFCHEIFVNDTLVGTLGSEETNRGRFSGRFDLGEGQKTVRVYFPWSARSTLLSFELDDGATAEAVSKAGTMLIYGDSITHGYDAKAPSRSYASLLTDALNVEALNKGIGAEVFCPELAALSEWKGTRPDLITVAYGTNDWSKQSREEFERTATEFYTTLSRRNPNARIFAITPIWRADLDRETRVGPFSHVTDTLQAIADSLPNVELINGLPFLPHDPAYFSDLYLHPNDEGFAYYFQGLLAEIQKRL